MSIAEDLSGGNPRTLGEAEAKVAAVLADPTLLGELFECLFVEDETVRMRASDALEKICRQKPEWLAAYKTRLLGDVPRIRQASVQWHLAQMLAEIQLSDAEKQRAIQIMEENLAMDDWIVTNLTLESLAQFARDGSMDRDLFRQIVKEQLHNQHQSVAKRAAKLVQEFGL